MIQAPTFDLNIPFNRNDAVIGDYATERRYKYTNFSGIYGLGIDCDFTSSTTGWTGAGLLFQNSSPYLGNTEYQSGIVVYSIDYIPPGASSDSTENILHLRDSSNITRMSINLTHSYGPNIISTTWSATNFSGTSNIFSSAVGSYTLGQIEIIAWRMTSTGSFATCSFYRNGVTSGGVIGSVAALRQMYRVDLSNTSTSTFNTDNLAFTIYDLQLFNFDIGSGYATNVTSAGGYNNYKQSINSTTAANNRKYFLYSTISNPGISVALTGQQATFDFRRLTIPRPTQVDFTLIK